ncbi:mechanosensitive ion channel [Sulfitobacter sp. M57]|uniref:mechanosensitive ion channel family protein n=1 Tax=Sulfitobacter sp. KE42 TaxID=2731155 RepID=UPI002A27BFB9|nr:mechanosensitive ion channel [Sulfitobacter sp. KE5]MDF3422260.1 mechanosensitive ion channel [Sulfitobacter sp. KE43]MDF3433325.1 mechanosensitive ion channel [Sulfitobacter sp. KE42]MDF3458965.1 mechanosensitive ion channel [Sulfitobacter sp. S74]MDF3462864.1 mechanosensitive ion channel [Sulfitobacter sp. Ks18]MDF3466764.1 mechanosensitive ion channel [Sulfitobacter sp. M05]MDF3470659.1 mechanosensitive ion channel [Sulfitobacter sp. M28]MDF3474408.1 mechanosensitive ion channel [Sulfi
MNELTDPFADFLATLEGAWMSVHAFLIGVLTPGWRQNQVLIVVGLALLAWLMNGRCVLLLERYVRSREGWAKWQLRFIVQLKQRLGLILFAVLASGVYFVMQNITWPSRSYLIGLAATLTAVWVGTAFAAQLVHDRFIRRIVRWSLWIYATLYLLNVSDDVAVFLDNIALEVGEFRLSVLTLITALVVISALLMMARFASKATASTIRKNEDISPSMQVLAVKGVQLALYGIAFYMGVKAVGIDLTGLAVLSGAIGVGLGFGLQKVVSNLVSGVIILLDKSIKPGDVISLGETFGWIQTLGARYASVVTRDGKEYLIPNEDLITGQVVNWSHSDDFVRLDIHFGTAYGDDPHQVRKLAIDAAAGVDRVLKFKPPVCHIVGFGDSSVDYILRFWIKDPTGGLTNIRGNVFLALWDTFQEHGISIPFPQREVLMLEESKLSIGRNGNAQ